MSVTAPMRSAADAQAAGASEIIIAYASGSADIDSAWQGLQLPQLSQLLSGHSPTPLVQGSEMDFSAPHERVLARSLGLPDAPGLIPWAAYQTGSAEACAFISPCHWHVGADQVVQSDSASTPLDEAESRELLALLAPWFAEDGITLDYLQPELWLARGAVFDGLAAASLDRVHNRDVRHWLPDPARGALIQRLQSEMQMLLYTHPFNDRRAERGQVPINSFWVHGAGRLPAPSPTPTPGAGTAAAVCIDDLRAPVLRGDVQAWRAAWQQLDATLIAALLQRVRAGETVRLSLCGERNALQWRCARGGMLSWIKGVFGAPSLPPLQKLL